MKIRALSLILVLALLAAAARQSEKPSAAAAAGQQVIQELAAGEFDKVEGQYSAQMSAALPPGKLAAAWAGLLEQAGSFDSIGQTNASKSQQYDVILLVCKFQKELIDARVVVDPEGKIIGLHFGLHQPEWTPPTYAKPDSFAEQPLIVVNGKFELPGTLAIPKGDGPFPAVVLVQGSGATGGDEDETIGPNKLFKDLAWGLASRGIAVFRYTKRTRKYGARSSTDPAKFTVDEETISDARAAVDLVAKQQKIDPSRIFLVGHSLGGYLAPRIAAGDARIAGIVMMAANTRPLEQLIVDQVRYGVSGGGVPSEEGQKEIATAEETAKKIHSPDLKPGDTVSIFGSSTPASYWLDLRGYHPVEAAATLKIPILILQGGRDFQVTPANFDDWKSALAGHKNVMLNLYPDLNHLFITGSGPSRPQEYTTPGQVSGDVAADVASWISASGKSPQ